MAALWNKPIVTWIPVKEDLESYPTLIATLGTYEDIARNIATLLHCQGWKAIGNILSPDVFIKFLYWIPRKRYPFSYKSLIQWSEPFQVSFPDVWVTQTLPDNFTVIVYKQAWRTAVKTVLRFFLAGHHPNYRLKHCLFYSYDNADI